MERLQEGKDTADAKPDFTNKGKHSCSPLGKEGEWL